jgi:hypothetical protein
MRVYTWEGFKPYPRDDKTVITVLKEGFPLWERDLYKLSLPHSISSAIFVIPRARDIANSGNDKESFVEKTPFKYAVISSSVSRYSALYPIRYINVKQFVMMINAVNHGI